MKRIIVSGLLFMIVTIIQPMPVSADEMNTPDTGTYDGSGNVVFKETENENRNTAASESTEEVVEDGFGSDQAEDIDVTDQTGNTYVTDQVQGTVQTDQSQDTDASGDTALPPQEGTDMDDVQEEDGDEGTDSLPGEVRTLSGIWKLNRTGWWFACDDGTWPAGEIAEIGGTRYAFNEAGYMVTGWYLDENGWYYFDGNGAMHKGWLLLGNTWYYLDYEDQEYPGRMTADCEKVINGARYFFAVNGDMKTGWILCPEGWYYVDNSGRFCRGWQQLKGIWYYLDGENTEYPGLMCDEEWKKVNGSWYYLTEGGAMAKNWLKQPEGWYYLGTDGARKSGWQQLGRTWYYLDAQNAEYPNRMCENEWKKINGSWYYLSGSGAMATGWIHLSEGWYYADTSGARKTGWQQVKGIWYYLDGENDEYPGLMAENSWNKINGKWYYLTESGAMAQNWLQKPEGKYYLGADGARRTGWQSIGGNWYYFYKEDDPNGGDCGVMATNTIIDGWNITASGIGINGTPENTPGDALGDIQSKLDYIKKKYVGVPYVWGGTTPNGWDCSGFTQWALKYLGVSIPRTVAEQKAGGRYVNKNNMSEWKPGDLLIYVSASTGAYNHVALYLGNGQMMHALSTQYNTLVQGVEYYSNWDKKNRLVEVRRYL